MIELFYILLFGIVISLIAFIGIFTLILKEELLNEILLLLVSFSAGTLTGGAFIHLLPEVLEISNEINIFYYLIFGIVLFFFIEKVLNWHHCHRGNPHQHTYHYMILIGDLLHNFIDGLILASAFFISFSLGIATSIAIAAHEIPQEIGDFGVLIYGGFRKKKALLLNFIVALAVVVGGIIGYYISLFIENAVVFLLPFASGGFIYIAFSDLIPELKKEIDIKKSIAIFELYILGILIMWVVRGLSHH
jgi:zinc and cadmium transporter